MTRLFDALLTLTCWLIGQRTLPPRPTPLPAQPVVWALGGGWVVERCGLVSALPLAGCVVVVRPVLALTSPNRRKGWLLVPRDGLPEVAGHN